MSQTYLEGTAGEIITSIKMFSNFVNLVTVNSSESAMK